MSETISRLKKKLKIQIVFNNVKTIKKRNIDRHNSCHKMLDISIHYAILTVYINLYLLYCLSNNCIRHLQKLKIRSPESYINI